MAKGTIALFLLFGIGFALYAGSGGVYGLGFLELWNQIGSASINTLTNMVVGAILNPISLVTISIAAIGTLGSGDSLKYTLPAVVIVALAQVLLIPFTFVDSLPAMNIYVVMLIRGFFNLLLMIAVLEFVLEREF